MSRPGEIIMPTQLLEEFQRISGSNSSSSINNNNNNKEEEGELIDCWSRAIGEFEIKEIRSKWQLSQIFPRKLKGRSKKISVSSFELLTPEEKLKKQLLEKLNHLNSENKELSKQLKNLKYLADEAQSKANELNLHFQELKKDLENRNVQIEDLHQQITDLLMQIDDLSKNYESVNRKLKAAKNLLRNLDLHIRTLCKQNSDLNLELDSLTRSSSSEIAQLRKQIQSLSKKRRSFITRLISKSPQDSESHQGGGDGDYNDPSSNFDSNDNN
jgi:DNA repair ATPase RecN